MKLYDIKEETDGYKRKRQWQALLFSKSLIIILYCVLFMLHDSIELVVEWGRKKRSFRIQYNKRWQAVDDL